MSNKYLYRMKFEYNQRGFGDLMLLANGDCTGAWLARSGSINKEGKLVNAIAPHTWYMIDGPESAHHSEKDKMRVASKPGLAWKQRMWPIPTPQAHDPTSHYLIHPDGSYQNMNDGNGTLGCIGILHSNAMELYYFFKWFFEAYKGTIVPIDITQHSHSLEGGPYV